ncbi:2,4-dienoyl-CoA reductase-like NADH-dependent reductase (Old Yellow Enzyme family) [Rhizobium sp. PP-F2F-G38]|nr:2,4-dienoyl-CoA reductase-like NADH-dependent reductase (Old Yellow Enzyme family) [Rhizobium sp. PP-F2F-G38]TCP82762.1 2,4-dienoyl-CoA reductase-like NADH-dependent reductase (Old Yellow Enzyme family) [Rhizobium sp. PP-CC-2G-626]
MSRLFDSLQVGALELPNRIIMAPLTRKRSGVARVPNAMMAEYYRQRAGAGLILSEATSVSPQGVGYWGTPGIWNDAQVQGWQQVTEQVHEAGGRIFLQLWHVGRISDPELLDGQLPVAPSAIAAAGHVSALRPKRPHPVPRPLETDEIPGIVEDFRQGAERAKAAGFDGVELHAANGYLIDQFLQDKTNKRTDRYGGSVENRARFLLEIVDALIEVWGADRVGVHLRPRGEEHDMGDSNPKAIFGFVADELAKRKIAFIFVREIEAGDSLLGEIKRRFDGPVIANELMSKNDGERLIEAGDADAVAFGRDYIANPDLAERLQENLPLNTPNKDTFYGEGLKGYTDYPRLLQPR